MEKMIEFQVKYKGKTYNFDCGAAAAHDERTLLDYIELVRECYVKDDNPTPLGHLADFIAENWDKVDLLTRREILTLFYEEI